MTSNKFSISGMTCQACVEKISNALKTIEGVSAVAVQLADGTAMLQTSAPLQLQDVQKSLANYPKYTVNKFANSADLPVTSKVQVEVSKLETYKPLIIVFCYVILASVAFQIYHGSFHAHLFMNHLMGGFFIGLSFFKILSLKAFGESFSSYDPIAIKVPGYGLAYPFIELGLGLLFIGNKYLLSANLVTIVILTATTVGVLKRLRSKTQIQCACLGTTFNLPLSYVTVFENVVMIVMAVTGILISR